MLGNLFRNLNFKVIRGHPRSKISENNIKKKDLSESDDELKMWTWTDCYDPGTDGLKSKEIFLEKSSIRAGVSDVTHALVYRCIKCDFSCFRPGFLMRLIWGLDNPPPPNEHKIPPLLTFDHLPNFLNIQINWTKRLFLENEQVTHFF